MQDENQILVLRDNLNSGLREIKTIETGLTHFNKLKTLEIWVKAEKKDAELQNMIAEQKLRTQRVLGAMIKEGKESGELTRPGTFNGNQYVGNEGSEQPKTLDDLGISRIQSSNFQKIANIPDQEFEDFISSKKEAVNNAVAELTTAGVLRMANGISQTYSESNRLTGYFNDKYARLTRAYAWYKDMDNSDVLNRMAQEFFSRMPEDEKKSMLDSYLGNLKMK